MVNLQETSTTMKLLPLLCLCLLTHSGRTFADGKGPVVVKEDSDVVLPCSLSSKENLESKLFDWKKDSYMEVFMYDAGRTYGNGFTGQDKEFEGLILKDRTEENISGAAPEPSVSILDQSKDWSLLQCAVRGASPKPVVEWRDSSGNILPAKEAQVTERGGSYDVILQTTVTKSDTYSCVVTQTEINHRTEAKTFVHHNGAASEPYVTTLEETKYWSLLQCAVRGASPKPVVEWRDSSGNILPAKEAQVTERGGSYDIILQTTVTKSDTYSCVVTQTEINHRTEAKIHVFISGSSTGLVVIAVVIAVFITLLIIGVVFAVLLATGRINCQKDEETRETMKETESDLLPA